jgi:tetratricopeptide (TPR) repeat protein
MQVYSLLHPNAPAKRTQAGQVCVHRSKIGLSMSHLASSARSFSASATKGLQRRGSLRRCRPTLQAGARDMEKPDHPDVAQSVNNLADLYLAQGRYADAEPLYKRALASTPEQKGSTLSS